MKNLKIILDVRLKDQKSMNTTYQRELKRKEREIDRMKKLHKKEVSQLEKTFNKLKKEQHRSE